MNSWSSPPYNQWWPNWSCPSTINRQQPQVRLLHLWKYNLDPRLFLQSFQLRIYTRILNILLNQPWFLSAKGFFGFRFFGFFLRGILLFLLLMRLFLGTEVYRLVLLAMMLLILRLCNLIFGLFKLRIILFGFILFLVKY